MAEVDDFHAIALEQTAHDVDRRIVAIKERCGRDYSDRFWARASSGARPNASGAPS
jgi:hypothetical protein